VLSKRILITGGAGYIGSHVVKALGEKKDCEIVVLDNLSTGFKEAVLHGKLVVGDLLDKDLLDSLFKQYQFDAIFHFAACTVIPDSIADPVKYYQNNTIGTLNLLEACQRYSTKHFIFSSTAAVYAPLADQKITEDDPIAPQHPYGRSKRMAEEMIIDFCKNRKMDYAILRYFNVAGAHPTGALGQRTLHASHLIKAAVETACGKRDRLAIFGTDYPTFDGTCIRDYIHVCDLADAHIQALEYLEDHHMSCILNCGYGNGTSVKQVVKALETISGKSLPVSSGSRREGDLAYVVADPSRLMNVLHWKPQYDDLNFIVKTAYEFEKTLS
jgi:UDP-glucose 4-epimerase